jgi:serine/alanine adding enzyme
MYTVKIGLSVAEHDAFIKASNLTNLLQSAKWAKIKDNWRHERIGFYQDDVLKSSVSILIKPLPLGLTMLYIPRGIVLDYSDTELLKFVLSELKKYGKSQHALFIKFDPAIAAEGSENLTAELQRLGVKWSGLTRDMHETIQPRYNAVIHRDDFSEDALSKKTRQFLRKARNSQPVFEVGGTELVADFADLMKKTETRKNVSLRNADYYTKLLETYGDDAFINLVKMDFGKLLAEAKDNRAKLVDNLAKAKNEKRLKALTNELELIDKTISNLTETVASRGEVIPVAGTLTLNFGGAAETLYAGTDTSFQKYYPSYLAWYEAINHAFETGAQTLNMGGLENALSASDGLLKFKKHFNPQIEVYVGEFDIPVNRFLFSLSEIAYKLRKKIR